MKLPRRRRSDPGECPPRRLPPRARSIAARRSTASPRASIGAPVAAAPRARPARGCTHLEVLAAARPQRRASGMSRSGTHRARARALTSASHTRRVSDPHGRPAPPPRPPTAPRMRPRTLRRSRPRARARRRPPYSAEAAFPEGLADFPSAEDTRPGADAAFARWAGKSCAQEGAAPRRPRNFV